MILPPLLVLTDRHQAAAPLVDVVAEAVEAGARAVVLREKDLPRPGRVELAAALAPVVHGVGGLLLSAGETLPGCDGIHLPTARRVGGIDATALSRPGGVVVGQSCHSADELRAAAAGGLDYVTLSPVYLTTSKPGYGPALGLIGLQALVAMTSLPVYALGGIETPEQTRSCRRAGAAGVAVMGAVMRPCEPGRVVADLLRATSEVVGR